MCGAADSNAVIKTNTTDRRDPVNRYLEQQVKMQGFDIAPPADAPDLTDKLVRQRRASQSLASLAGRGRSSSFLGASDYGPLAQRGSSLLGSY